MNATATESEDTSQSVTFAFGHVVGLGIQELLTHGNLDLAIWRSFLTWEPDLLAENQKQNKSFWLAVAAVQRFQSMRCHGFLADWELAEFNGAPATELSFIVHFPGSDFTYKGYVDAVLQNAATGEVMVLEVKTTSSNNLNSAQYKNSAQAIGYSIVLDALFPQLSSYQVQYLIYKTKTCEFDVMQFDKSYLARALWIRELMLDVQKIQMYDEAGIFPMHGESCYSFFRECEYFGLCTLATEKLTEPLDEAGDSEIRRAHAEDFQIVLSMTDLIEAQLGKE